MIWLIAYLISSVVTYYILKGFYKKGEFEWTAFSRKIVLLHSAFSLAGLIIMLGCGYIAGREDENE